MADITRTIWDVRPGEHLAFEGGRINVEILNKSGKRARLLVTAPLAVSIQREDGASPALSHDAATTET